MRSPGAARDILLPPRDVYPNIHGYIFPSQLPLQSLSRNAYLGKQYIPAPHAMTPIDLMKAIKIAPKINLIDGEALSSPRTKSSTGHDIARSVASFDQLGDEDWRSPFNPEDLFSKIPRSDPVRQDSPAPSGTSTPSRRRPPGIAPTSPERGILNTRGTPRDLSTFHAVRRQTPGS